MRTKRVTIKDIATEAGVSIALVSFVMNNKSDGKETYRVNKETAQRILEVAQKLNYQPNNAARTLRSGKTNTIGVIVSDISNKFFADIARCIENHAYKHKYTVLFGSTDENPQKLENLVEVFRNKGIDGLIVVPCEGADEIIRDIARQNIPLVLLDREVPDLEVSSVVLNNRRAGHETTEALIRRGFTRIEMISYSMGLSNIREREEGYRRCMQAHEMGENAVIHHLRQVRQNRGDHPRGPAAPRRGFPLRHQHVGRPGPERHLPQRLARAPGFRHRLLRHQRSLRHLQNRHRLRPPAHRTVRDRGPRPADQEHRTARQTRKLHTHRADARNRRERPRRGAAERRGGGYGSLKHLPRG